MAGGAVIIGQPVPHRRGWSLGPLVISGPERRCALTHVESGESVWIWGDTPEERQERAHSTIDGIYQRRWDLMADLIEEGDRRGPNVRSLDGLGPTAS